MANVKRRLNAPKSARKNVSKRRMNNGCTKKKLRSLRSVTDDQITNGIMSSETEPRIAKKHNNKASNIDDEMTLVTPHENYNFLHKLNTKLNLNKTSGVRTTRQSKQPDINTPELPGLMKTKTNHLRSTKFLKIMDNVIKNELGITSKLKKTNSSSKTRVNNNNKSEIVNQNNKVEKYTKQPEKNYKTTSQIKKTATVVSVHLPEAPENVPPVPVKSNEQQITLVNFADEPKALSPPPLRKKGRPKKNPEIEKTPVKQKQATHTNSVYHSQLLFECDYCNKIFNRKHSLVRHVYLHLGRKPHSCPVCPKKFRILKNMKNHMDRDHCVPNVDENTETYSCNICDKPFLTKENLKLHLTSHAKGENSFKCIYCDKKFSYQLLLIQHEKKHLVTGKYLCTLCDVKFNSRDKLYVHVKSHLKLTDYICQYCGREFLRANSMKRHVQTMHRGRTIQCPICNKNLKGHLTEHMRTHDNKRPHKCPDCGKLFAQSTQLKVHRRGHTGYRPYSCRICDRPFSHSNALMLHLRRHTGEKPFPCAECPMSFSQLPHMKAHMSKIHGKVNPYKCLKCYDYFKLKKDLLVHKKICKGTGFDTDLYGDERPDRDGSQGDFEVVPVESTMTLSRMRFLLALLLTMIASKEKLKYLGA